MKKLVLRVAVGDPLELVAFVARRVTDGDAATLIRAGAVHVNQRRQNNPKTRLTVGARVTIFAVAERGVERTRVIWSDDAVAVLEKPAGQRSQAVRQRDDDTLDADLRALCGPSATALHRLDRDTSGLVLAARTDEARRALTVALAEGAIDRGYLAVVARPEQPLPPTIALPITRALDDPRKRRALPAHDPSGEPAVTHVAVRATVGNRQLVELTLETGRTHQIRVHLAAVGAPIVGDALYDGPPAERLLLHAHRLSFPDPETGERRELTSAPTGEMAEIVANLRTSQTASH